MPREVISMHIGQAGIQIGHAFWELMTLEHGIKLNGSMTSHHSKNGGQVSAGSFFTSLGSSKEKFIPMAIFVDTDDMVIDEIRTGSYKQLFHPGFLISSYEDASTLFPRGYSTVGKEVLFPTIEALRKLSETTDNVHGIIFFRSFGGGTGSGATSRLLHDTENDLSKVPKSEIVVYPAPCLSTSIVEPYNTVLSTFRTMDHMDISLIMDNQALYDICKHHLEMEKPSYFNANKVVAHVVSSLTTCLRFTSVLSSDVTLFQTNLVPFPKLIFPVISYAPILSPSKRDSQPFNATILTEQVFQRHNFLIKCFPEHGEYMACALLYRGEGLQARETSIAIEKVKSSAMVRFVDWCPTGFKVGINHQRPPYVQYSCISKTDRVVCLIANSTCVAQVFDFLIQKFDILYKSKAYVHWFTGEGLEEAELVEARIGIVELLLEYIKHSTLKKK